MSRFIGYQPLMPGSKPSGHTSHVSLVGNEMTKSINSRLYHNNGNTKPLRQSWNAAQSYHGKSISMSRALEHQLKAQVPQVRSLVPSPYQTLQDEEPVLNRVLSANQLESQKVRPTEQAQSSPFTRLKNKYKLDSPNKPPNRKSITPSPQKFIKTDAQLEKLKQQYEYEKAGKYNAQEELDKLQEEYGKLDFEIDEMDAKYQKKLKMLSDQAQSKPDTDEMSDIQIRLKATEDFISQLKMKLNLT